MINEFPLLIFQSGILLQAEFNIGAVDQLLLFDIAIDCIYNDPF